MKTSEWFKQPSPLSATIRASLDLFVMGLPTDAGYREDKYWSDEEEETLQALQTAANKESEYLIMQVEDPIKRILNCYEADGFESMNERDRTIARICKEALGWK